MSDEDTVSTLQDWIATIRDNETAASRAEEAPEKDEVDSALENISTVFKFAPECRTADEVETFLKGCFTAQMSNEDIVEKMCPWLEDLRKKFGIDEDKAFVAADNTQDLNGKLLRFVRSGSAASTADTNIMGASPWPFVALVT